MRGGLFVFPLYVEPEEAAAADMREVVQPVTSNPPPGSEAFNPQRLSNLIRSASNGGLGDASETSADVLNGLPKWAHAVVQTGCFNALENGALQDCLDELDAKKDMEIEDEGALPVLATQAQRVAHSVEKYAELLGQVLEKATLRQQHEDFERDEMDVFSLADVKTLSQVQLGLALDVQSAITPSSDDEKVQFPDRLASRLEMSLDVAICELIECWKKNDERDNRVVVDNFVEDLIVMFVRPEWVGAEDLLEVLSSSLASILKATTRKDTAKPDSQQSLAALNLVGKIF
ncbi:hypothetical protein BBO99_00003170 [Phytophthora kernoviae]|uniref:Uncharacterized protein n=2 Tax=Phytophthora kernoviae TaxID=325452 RepID=A0A3R7KW37_9STRA|nr:hypothetical protein G195_002607 [Phytophthora kernoviae 00238/432]KAG2532389.1 hypothetical protein JM16_000340 [Phytophthora kernoviae]KAG2533452.1 hypothetical protein JM18_000256 [Phytophthora kernoviae]RLN05731.1 hypothetical protein BBI17_003281 [Phytophthora kernoviae]RLN82069.1 hypothetical protein BBO99_00003170 [Phytophthora kernoviae]